MVIAYFLAASKAKFAVVCFPSLRQTPIAVDSLAVSLHRQKLDLAETCITHGIGAVFGGFLVFGVVKPTVSVTDGVNMLHAAVCVEVFV